MYLRAKSASLPGWQFLSSALPCCPILKNLLKTVENCVLPVEKSDFQVYFIYKEYNNQNNKTEGDCIYALHRQVYGGVPGRGIDR